MSKRELFDSIRVLGAIDGLAVLLHVLVEMKSGGSQHVVQKHIRYLKQKKNLNKDEEEDKSRKCGGRV